MVTIIQVNSPLLYPFFLPAIIFVGAGGLLYNLPLSPLLQFYLTPVFPGLTLVIILLGWRFNHSRLILAQGLLALALTLHLIFIDQPLVQQSLGLLLPFNLLLILLLPEKGLTHPLIAIYGTILLGQCLGGLWISAEAPEQIAPLLNFTLPFLSGINHAFGTLQILVLVVVLLFNLLLFWRRPKPIEAAFFWSILMAQMALILPSDRVNGLLFFNLATLNLLAGLFETSHSMAYRDELTGISGRRALNERLKRLRGNYVLAMVDIDHFKKFNDTHGHDTGDQVLRMVAKQLTTLKGGGKAFRYGGEEFTLVFAGKKAAECVPHLEEIRAQVANAKFIPRAKDRPPQKPRTTSKRTSFSPHLSVTISIGAASFGRELSSPEQVLQAADKALYRAKQQGRNRVVV